MCYIILNVHKKTGVFWQENKEISRILVKSWIFSIKLTEITAWKKYREYIADLAKNMNEHRSNSLS